MMIENRTNPNGAFGTHITPLVAIAMATPFQDFFEFGMGDFSTPVLHEIVKYQNRTGTGNRILYSFENDKQWLVNFEDLNRTWHQIRHVQDWDKVDILPQHPVVLIDHAPAERRAIEIDRFKHKASYIIVHDTEKTRFYGYEPLLSCFKYRKDYTRYTKQTTIVSNYNNLDYIVCKI